jgi:hypothetical protein
VSSSAPMLALVDFTEYLDVVNSTLSEYLPECPREIENAMIRIQEMEKTIDGRVELEKKFKSI